MPNTIKYKRGDLIKEAPRGVIVHCCNCRGEWGAGFARQLRDADQMAYSQYKLQCSWGRPEDLLGRGLLIPGEKILTGNLMVSRGFGAQKDAPETISKYIEQAVPDLVAQARKMGMAVANHFGATYPIQFHSPLMGSGLFAAPWSKTEAVIQAQLAAHDIRWTVWKL